MKRDHAWRAAERSALAPAGPTAELSMASVMALRLLASVRRSPARSEPDAALSAKARAALLRPLMYSAKSAPLMDPPLRPARARRSF
jgi:hypothetical protein